MSQWFRLLLTVPLAAALLPLMSWIHGGDLWPPFMLPILIGMAAYLVILKLRLDLIRWLIPDLGHCASDEEMDEVLSAASPRRHGWINTTIAVAFAIVFVIGISRATMLVIPRDWVELRDWLLKGFVLLPFVLWPLFWAVLVRQRLTKHVRRQLNLKKDLQLCLRCGYNLHGTTTSRCPECGAPSIPRPDS